jgi:hypothetical protein
VAVYCASRDFIIYRILDLRKNSENLPYSILVGVIGVALGVWVAELIRRKFGLDSFFGRISATRDINDQGSIDKIAEN